MLDGNLNSSHGETAGNWSVALFMRNLAQAISASTLPEECYTLALDCRWLIKLAEDPSCAENVLLKLASSPIAEIRIAVADNVNAGVAVLEKLVRDEDCDVRYALAENHNISKELLDCLSNDDNPYVASRAQKTLHRLMSAAKEKLSFPSIRVDSSPMQRRRAG